MQLKILASPPTQMADQLERIASMRALMIASMIPTTISPTASTASAVALRMQLMKYETARSREKRLLLLLRNMMASFLNDINKSSTTTSG